MNKIPRSKTSLKEFLREIMFVYHDSEENKERLVDGRCRCATEHKERVFALCCLVKEGRIQDPYEKGKHLGELPTVPETATEAYKPGVYIYAVSATFEMRIALDCDRDLQNAIKHESLFKNADVIAAGEIRFSDGCVSYLDDKSGSYGTLGALEGDPDFVRAILTAFSQGGIPVLPELHETLTDSVED